MINPKQKRAGELNGLLTDLMQTIVDKTSGPGEAITILSHLAASVAHRGERKVDPVLAFLIVAEVSAVMAQAIKGEFDGGTLEEVRAIAKGQRGEGGAA